jgi:hypothetical protein
MSSNVNAMGSGNPVGLARAWGAQIRMLVAAIVTRQARISEKLEKRARGREKCGKAA